MLIVGSYIGQVVLADTAPIVWMLGAGASRPIIGIAVLLIGFALSLGKSNKGASSV